MAQVEGAGFDAEIRKGDFGYHTTKVGKIVYPRIKRRFSRRDFERIGKKLYFLERDDPEGEPTWWFKLMQDITISMLKDVLEALPFFKDAELDPAEIYFGIYNAGRQQLALWIDALRAKGYGNIANAIEEFDKIGTGRK